MREKAVIDGCISHEGSFGVYRCVCVRDGGLLDKFSVILKYEGSMVARIPQLNQSP